MDFSPTKKCLKKKISQRKKIFLFALKSFLNHSKKILRVKKLFRVFCDGEICLWISEIFGVTPGCDTKFNKTTDRRY